MNSYSTWFRSARSGCRWPAWGTRKPPWSSHCWSPSPSCLPRKLRRCALVTTTPTPPGACEASGPPAARMTSSSMRWIQAGSATGSITAPITGRPSGRPGATRIQQEKRSILHCCHHWKPALPLSH